MTPKPSVQWPIDENSSARNQHESETIDFIDQRSDCN